MPCLIIALPVTQIYRDHTWNSRVSFSFLSKGGEMRLYGLLGGKSKGGQAKVKGGFAPPLKETLNSLLIYWLFASQVRACPPILHCHGFIEYIAHFLCLSPSTWSLLTTGWTRRVRLTTAMLTRYRKHLTDPGRLQSSPVAMKVFREDIHVLSYI